MNYLDYEQLSTLPVMATCAISLAIFWGTVMEICNAKLSASLTSTEWWHRNAIEPSKTMMYNFGYPKTPTDRFPNGVTEDMARDFYAFLITICAQHFLSALPMLPVLWIGWEDSSDAIKSLFILGTLSDLGFDIYDAAKCSMRAFQKNHPSPLPVQTWFILVCMHHTTALSLVLPMNLRYLHRFEYHQTAASLLMAASLCYLLGCYKFTLDIGKRRDFLMYKVLVLSQLITLLYTRVYLWFPAASSFRAHLKEQGDTMFFNGASVMIGIFSLFNLILVVDGFKAAFNCLFKKMPKTKAEIRRTSETFRRYSGIDAPEVVALQKLIARRKFKGAVRSIIATNRLSSSMSSGESINNGKTD